MNERASRPAMICIAASCLLLDAAFLATQLRSGGWRPDFLVFWTAGHIAPDLGHVYDAQILTMAQRWLAGAGGALRPFAYPPTALLVFLPLGRIPFAVAITLWTIVSIAAWAAAVRACYGPAIMRLAWFAPPAVLCIATGQTSLLTAAGMLAAVRQLDRRPVLSGILLGLIAAFKPQVMLLAPLALIRAGAWRAGFAATATGAGIVLIAAVAFGIDGWAAWLGATRRFAAIAAPLAIDGVTPAAAAATLGLPPLLALAVQGVGIALGAALVWGAFGRDDYRDRILALGAGGLLCSPYAMSYELVILAPAMVAALLARRDHPLVVGSLLTGLAAPWGLAALALMRLPHRPLRRIRVSSTFPSLGCGGTRRDESGR